MGTEYLFCPSPLKSKNVMLRILYIFLLFCLGYCSSHNEKKHQVTSKSLENEEPETEALAEQQQNKGGNTVESRFPPPEGFQRVQVKSESFKAYLRQLSLKPKGSKVNYYDGNTKPSRNIYLAVANQEIGNKNLHQCADAIIRLRADFLWKQKRYEHIQFDLTNGFTARYSKWMNGERLAVNGNKTYWVKKTEASNSYDDFWEYLEMIFMYAGTASLEKELVAKTPAQIEIGDVFLQGGFPGHAILVVDKVRHIRTGETRIMLGQSYMPAQQFQILANTNDVRTP